jgi:hypothetical protein
MRGRGVEILGGSPLTRTGDGEVYLQPLNMTTVGAPPPGAEPDLVKPSSVPNPALPDASILPDTLPVKPAVPSKNGHAAVPA